MPHHQVLIVRHQMVQELHQIPEIYAVRVLITLVYLTLYVCKVCAYFAHLLLNFSQFLLATFFGADHVQVEIGQKLLGL